jgi:hypothetical protein
MSKASLRTRRCCGLCWHRDPRSAAMPLRRFVPEGQHLDDGYQVIITDLVREHPRRGAAGVAWTLGRSRLEPPRRTAARGRHAPRANTKTSENGSHSVPTETPEWERNELKGHANAGITLSCDFSSLRMNFGCDFRGPRRVWELDVGGSNPSTPTQEFGNRPPPPATVAAPFCAGSRQAWVQGGGGV